jgi:hypothetical protein
MEPESSVQEQRIHVTVQKKGGCLSGCGTAFGVLLLIGFAIKYWYVSVAILLILVVVGVASRSQQKQQSLKRAGPHDSWLNEVAVALAEFGLTEFARNTGAHLGGVPMMADVGLQTDRFSVYVNLFASDELARQAEIGLRAQPNIRAAVGNGRTALRASGRVLYVATGRGGVVDELRLQEVVHIVRGLAPPASSPGPQLSSDALEQLRRLSELHRTGALTDAEFEAKKAELLRRV